MPFFICKIRKHRLPLVKINYMNTIRCSICGKFISYAEMQADKIHSVFTFDTEYTSENIEFYHKDCMTAVEQRDALYKFKL